MLTKPLELIGKEDLDALLKTQLSESMTLDYKRDLSGNSDKDTKEFLADITAFANTAGGDLIFGVDEDQGCPIEIPGVVLSDPDAYILRIEQILASGIEPRLPHVGIHVVPGFEKGPVLILRIPKSFAAPHMVPFKDSSRFFYRTNSGKMRMNVQQIRSAFDLSSSIQNQVRDFRLQRISDMLADQGPVEFDEKHRLMLHVIPLDAFSLGTPRDLATYWARKKVTELVMGMTRLSFDTWRLNFEGFLITQKPPVEWLLQYFRNGIIEFVTTDFAYEDDPLLIYRAQYEVSLVNQLQEYFKLLLEAQVRPPYVVSLTLLNVKGCFVNSRNLRFDRKSKISNDHLILEPRLVLSEGELHAGKVLKPMLDIIWQAMGLDGTPQLDDEGNLLNT